MHSSSYCWTWMISWYSVVPPWSGASPSRPRAWSSSASGWQSSAAIVSANNAPLHTGGSWRNPKVRLSRPSSQPCRERRKGERDKPPGFTRVALPAPYPAAPAPSPTPIARKAVLTRPRLVCFFQLRQPLRLNRVRPVDGLDLLAQCRICRPAAPQGIGASEQSRVRKLQVVLAARSATRALQPGAELPRAHRGWPFSDLAA